MSFEKVRQYFENAGLGERLIVPEKSSATVEEAAEAVGCQPRQIAKTLSFFLGNQPVLIVMAGDARVDNKKYRDFFHLKAKMIPGDQVESSVGHAPGGVCPFVILPNVPVYLDVSLRRFDYVYPAAGSGHSAVKLTLEELETHSHFTDWIDVCKDWQEQN